MTAGQVADALGVRPATVYAYVSRGALPRATTVTGTGQGASLLDRDEVLALGGMPWPGELAPTRRSARAGTVAASQLIGTSAVGLATVCGHPCAARMRPSSPPIRDLAPRDKRTDPHATVSSRPGKDTSENLRKTPGRTRGPHTMTTTTPPRSITTSAAVNTGAPPIECRSGVTGSPTVQARIPADDQGVQ